jgi:L-2-hydroxyglutarate oxidase LhgO|tara:strand:+ start:144 stop:338 length:195 start_codon:yes stop_codon:yes gene_type:complete
MVQKTKLKAEFNKAGLQITREAIDQLDDEINRSVKKMVSRVKEGNVKRLTAALIWVALGNWNNR